MKLEIGDINIKDVKFGGKTEIINNTLVVNRQELCALLAKDKSLTDVTIELAHPGESLRICRVADVIEPRARTGART